MQRRDTLAEAREDRLDAPQVGGALTLGSVAQTLAGALLAGLAQGVDKQTGTADHMVAGAAKGLLVMLEPAAQFAGRQRRIGQRGQQLIGMLSVGARQWHHDPGSRS